MNEIKNAIPNTLTCLNLFTGCLAIIFIFNGHFYFAGFFVGISAVFDFFDGLAARVLKVNSEIGKQLDSLADLISFGLVPGLVLYQLISISLLEYNTPLLQRPVVHILLSLAGFIVPIFSALRLAKFNIDTEQSIHFKGMPTPANAILITSIPLMLHYDLGLPLVSSSYLISSSMLFNPVVFVGASLVLSNLLIIDKPFFSLKVKNLSFQGNEIQFIFITCSILIYLISSIFFHYFFFPIFIIMILYVILSLAGEKYILKNINTLQK